MKKQTNSHLNTSDIYGEPQCRTYPAYRTRGARMKLETLVSALLAARRRVIIAGAGANHFPRQGLPSSPWRSQMICRRSTPGQPGKPRSNPGQNSR